MSLSVAPGVPATGGAFEVTAAGTATPGTGSVYLMVILAPRTEACQPTAALAEATYYDHQLDERWGRWWENRVDPTYQLAQVFDGRPLGKYRLCGYLSRQGIDPMATAGTEFTIGGTCDSAIGRVAAREKAATKKSQSLKRAKKAHRSARAQDKPHRVVKRAAKKVRTAQHQLKHAKRQLRSAKSARHSLC
ncbi:hypothetical protein [Nocardioides sp. YIM 152315]|uniref:hypothetical protein n=1 Tax=Nocardioides sp. YIM 152315 TaxID=3031760 RepID=UPI0023DB0DC5|nr:hypothetical protein [Nocardioides sp. YIM 152315]MDF1605797.1 hypothetical protein [Nocardioides sp. YIM 152315]